MPKLSSRFRRPALLLAACVVLPLALWAALPLGALGADPAAVQREIQAKKGQEASLASAAAKLGQLEAVAERGVTVLEQRQAAAQAELERWQTKLAATENQLAVTKAHLADQKKRYAKDRTVLANALAANFEQGPAPDLVSLVVDAHGFQDLLTQVDFAERAQSANAAITDNVRQARDASQREQAKLNKIVPEQRDATNAVLQQRNALAEQNAALQARKTALADARQARLEALSATRSSRIRAEKTLTKLLAAQQTASTSQAGPGGPWAIPWAIVQCESGGQNLPPNSAGASGYYQFMPATWKALGGSTPAAYLAGKPEQDRLAAKLWNGGAGASNWVCAGIVGIH